METDQALASGYSGDVSAQAGGTMALEQELKTYAEKLPSLLEQQGKYVVICGDKVLGVFNDYEDALSRGYGECGDVPFLVKKIEQDESVQYFRRDIIEPCRASTSP